MSSTDAPPLSPDNITCKSCQLPIDSDGNIISFGDNFFHVNCFNCSKCTKSLSDALQADQEILLLSNGLPVCEACSYKCRRCQQGIYDEAIMTQEGSYHEDCFTCDVCSKKINDLVYVIISPASGDDADGGGLFCLECSKKRDGTDTTPSKNAAENPFGSSASVNSLGIKSQSNEDALRRKLAETEQVLEKFQSASKTALNEYQMVKDRLSSEAAARKKLEDEVHSLKQALLKKDASLREAQAMNDRLSQQNRISTAIGQHGDGTAEKEAIKQLHELESQYSELLTKKTGLLSELAQLQTTISSLQYQLTNLTNEKKFLSDENAKLKDQKASLEAQMFDARERQEQLERDSWILRQTISELEASVKDLEKKVALETTNLKMKQQAVVAASAPAKAVYTSQESLSDKKIVAGDLPTKSHQNSGSRDQLAVPRENGSSNNEGLNVKRAARKSLDINAKKAAMAAIKHSPSKETLSGAPDRSERVGAKIMKWISLKTNQNSKKKNDKPHQLNPQTFYVSGETCVICADVIKTYDREMQCKACGLACHDVCSASLGLTCSGDRSNLRVPLFGNDLAIQCQYENRDTPIIIVNCIQAVEARGIKAEGIYRKSGLASHIRLLIEKFNSSKTFGEEINLLDDQQWPDVNVVTGILKQYLRTMPVPLTTFELYAVLVEGYLEQNENERLRTTVDAVASLPRQNFESLKLLLFHLKKITSMQDKNLMNSKNLAVVFGPNLLRSPKSAAAELEGTLSPDSELMDMGYKNNVTEYLIDNCTEIYNYAEKKRAGLPYSLPGENDNNPRASYMTETEISMGSYRPDPMINNSSYVVVSGDNGISQSFANMATPGRPSNLRNIAEQEDSLLTNKLKGAREPAAKSPPDSPGSTNTDLDSKPKTACFQCRSAHVACDKNRPCSRCKRLAKECEDVNDENRSHLQNHRLSISSGMDMQPKNFKAPAPVDSNEAVPNATAFAVNMSPAPAPSLQFHSSVGVNPFAAPVAAPPPSVPLSMAINAGTSCGNCRNSHVSCDKGRPCSRCVRLGWSTTCADVPNSRKSSSFASGSSFNAALPSMQAPPPPPPQLPMQPPSHPLQSIHGHKFIKLGNRPSSISMDQLAKEPFVGGIPYYVVDAVHPQITRLSSGFNYTPSSSLSAPSGAGFAEPDENLMLDLDVGLIPPFSFVNKKELYQYKAASQLNAYPTPAATPSATRTNSRMDLDKIASLEHESLFIAQEPDYQLKEGSGVSVGTQTDFYEPKNGYISTGTWIPNSLFV